MNRRDLLRFLPGVAATATVANFATPSENSADPESMGGVNVSTRRNT